VREALLELSFEGLVAVAPRSGITVLGITPDDAVDSFAVLAALSGKGAQWATARMTQEELARLHDLAQAVTDAEDVVAANWRFHQALNRAAGSRRLLVHLRQAVRAVPASYFELFPAQEERSLDEHAALLRAIRRGDGAKARVLAESHILDAGAALGDWLRQQNADARQTPHASQRKQELS
jgi:DNA-binding GntR family transcriptional regulator